MTEPTKAEIMLDSVTKSNRLINYLRFCKEHPIPPLRLDLRPSTKVSIKAYQDGVQNYIDRLTAQNEKVVSLVKQIPDGEVQLVFQKVKDEWGMTNFQEVTVLEDQPCKLSFETLTSSTGDPVATVSQSVKLFISPDVVIKAGSKIIVTQHGRTTEYSNSGVPAVYPTHQEIMLTLFEGWA